MQIVRPLSVPMESITTNVPEDEGALWDQATEYGLGDTVIRDHRVYISTINPNSAIDPALENQNLTSVRWLFTGYTNAYRMVDGTIGNRTITDAELTIDMVDIEGAQALLIFGVRAASISLQAYDSNDQVILDDVTSMSGRSVYNFYQWFTEPLGEAATKLVKTDLPVGTVRLALTIAGAAVEVGEIVVGELLTIGKALVGSKGRVKSYSRFEFNSYGQLVQIKGPTRNVMTYEVHIPAFAYPAIKDIMDRLAGDLVGSIGSPNRPSTVQLGVLGAIQWSEALPDDYIISFQVDGVI